MIPCPQCGFDNPDQAIVCERCYLLLGIPSNEGESTTLPADVEMRTVFVPQRPARPQIALAKHSLALYIGDLNIPIVLQVPDAAYLGRLSDMMKVHPLLDLTPFGAHAKGVSRLHAALHRVGAGIAIEDLNSANGTHFNAVRLKPNVLFTLRSGSTVHLGILAIEIVWDDKAQRTNPSWR